jgi:6-phosphogluconolactonase (cycloisomerase 2 family)
VYVLVDRLPDNQLYGFSTDATGSLIALPGFPILTGGLGTPGGGSQAETVAFDGLQNRLYVANVFSKTVSAYSVDASSGALTALPFSPIVLPGSPDRDISIALSPNGSVLVVGNTGGLVYSYKIGPAAAIAAPGSPFSTGGAPGDVTPFSATFSRDGAYLYAGGPKAAAFSVDNNSAALTSLAGSPYDVGASFALAFQTDSAGRFFNSNNASPSLLRAHTTSAGIPTLVFQVASSQGGIQTAFVHPSGYYVTTALTGDVGVFRINGSGGATTLTQVAGSPFVTGGTNSNISVLDSSGTLVLTANSSSLNLTAFQFNTTTGAMAGLNVQAANTLGASGVVVGMGFAPYAAAPPPTGSPTPAPVPTSFPPTISQISDQVVLQNSSVSVPFTISGALVSNALSTSVSSSNSTLLPVGSSTLSTTCTSSGSCTLLIAPADGRAGTAVVTVSVTDGYYTTTRSLNVTVPDVRPSAPAVVLANVVGSGIVLTWTAPDTGTPTGYAIGWGTDAAASNLPTQLVPPSSTRFEFSALPSGTYYFQVFAIGTGDLSRGSTSTSATVATSATVPGPPLGLTVTPSNSGFNAGWTAPRFGATPTLYEVQIGTTFGIGDAGGNTTTAASYATSIGAGSYWVRTRASAGGSTGAWSNSVQIPVGGASCSTAPGAPILLPVSTTSGSVAFTWVPVGVAADSYEVQIAPGAGLPSIASLTAGPAASLVWAQTSGGYAARVVARNSCGTSTRSNEVAFTIVP